MSKDQGDLAELTLTLKAKKLGFTVLTPYSSICKYDIAIDSGKKIHRMQVKSTSSPENLKTGSVSYKFLVAHGKTQKTKYTSKQIDFVALYIMSLDLFYIIPVNEIKTTSVRIYPSKTEHKYTKYREAWHQLK